MKFDIIGTGAMGLLFASKLSLVEHEVKLWSSSEDKAELLNTRGVTYTGNGPAQAQQLSLMSYPLTEEYINEQATQTHNNNNDRDDINSVPHNYAIIAVKQAHIDDRLITLLKMLNLLRGYDAIIALQNGRGHIEKLGQALQLPILTAITSEAAKRQDNAAVIHTGKGETWIGDELKRDIFLLHQKNVVNALEKAGFAAFVSKNIKEQVLLKLLRNAVINPLTALFDVPNGQLPLSQQRLALMEKLFIETKNVLSTEESSIARCSFDEVLALCHATAPNTSSMRADVQNGVITEIAYINGAVASIAQKHGLSAPLNISMVHMIEALHPER